MNTAACLPLPSLGRGRFLYPEAAEGEQPVFALTDDALADACGVRIAFTERTGGVSEAPFNTLNLGNQVNDDPRAVQRNRRKLLHCLGFTDAQLVVPKQVHGTQVVVVGAHATLEEQEAAREAAEAGADAVVTAKANLAALLCFADCVPVIMVAPRGAFAVAHAGWRGVYGRVAVAALEALCAEACCDASECNVYLGPYLHAECFEVSADLANKFRVAFGPQCAPDERHVDMGQALRTQLLAAGAADERIADTQVCTYCNADRFFSYRKDAGVTGRHGALAVRRA